MRARQVRALLPRTGGALRLAATVLLLGVFAGSTTGCDLLLGIEDVEEIQPTGGGGTGGAGGTGGTGGTGGCIPSTCGSPPDWQCGTGDDGCGTFLDCGGCDSGFACNNNTHECVCQAASCEFLQWQCGVGPDHCGVQLDCGACPGGAPCVDHVCCNPSTCDDLGWECGSGPNGCGGTVTCPGCQEGFTCNAAKQCECVPVDPCTAHECGQFDDGCGKPVSCGDCSDVCGFAAACSSGGVCDCSAPK